MSVITWLVGRMHVGTPYREVLRDIRRRCRHMRGRKHRKQRHEFYREAVEAHRANRQLCRDFRF